jgi:hypothetical protein
MTASVGSVSGLLDPSQEGFRRLRSTQRQIQSLHWAIEDAAARRELIYIVYVDFENAFNSLDHEALWRWLEELNVPDVALIRALYTGAYYSADLPYGRSPPVYLTSLEGALNTAIFCLLCCLTYCLMVSYIRSVGAVWGSEQSAVCVPPAGGTQTI